MKIFKCRSCGSKKLETVIDLGMQAWGNDFKIIEEIEEAALYPLECDFCHDCSLLQLNFTVPKEKMFSEHTYVSGSTKTLRKHFKETAKQVAQYLKIDPKKLKVLDIGSNDGTQLQCYKEIGVLNVLGVESAHNIAEIANKNGVPTDKAFFNLDYAEKKQDTFNIISASGVFFHLEELHSALMAVKKLLSHDGIFVVQFIYLKRMVENLAFDQIYHEHLVYYLFSTLQNLLLKYKLEIVFAKESPIHGGSGIAYISHYKSRPVDKSLHTMIEKEKKDSCLSIEYYYSFMERITNFKDRNRMFVEEQLKKGMTIYGLGAPVKGNTLINYLKLTNKEIKYLVEINPLRKGMKAPQSNIPILMEEEISVRPDVYYCLAWNFKQEILKRHSKDIENGTFFYFPVDPGDV